MQTLRFKTNIDCGNCRKAITPTLNGEPDKVLIVSINLSSEQVRALVAEAGFEAQAA